MPSTDAEKVGRDDDTISMVRKDFGDHIAMRTNLIDDLNRHKDRWAGEIVADILATAGAAAETTKQG